MTEAAVEVLLATYNGGRYVREQLRSLFAQTHSAIRVTARDDGSTDETPAILAAAARAEPGRMVVLVEDGVRRGARGSFDALLRASSSEHVMFCDQDDRWHPEKVARTLARMRSLEGRVGACTPCLVHGDLVVVDARLRTLAPSLARHARLDLARGTALNRLLVSNVVVGCTAMLNRALVALARGMPDEAVMHDWWAALVAASCGGAIEPLSTPLVDYRQHGANTVGAVGLTWRDAGVLARSYLRGDSRRLLVRSRAQAARLLELHGHRMSDAARAQVREYSRLGESAYLQRRLVVVRHGFWKHGLVRNLGMLAHV